MTQEAPRYDRYLQDFERRQNQTPVTPEQQRAAAMGQMNSALQRSQQGQISGAPQQMPRMPQMPQRPQFQQQFQPQFRPPMQQYQPQFQQQFQPQFQQQQGGFTSGFGGLGALSNFHGLFR
jgi:hypothetical protein